MADNNKRRLTGVLLTGKGSRPVRHKQQPCYLVCIQEINNGSEFYIVKKNFKVKTPLLLPSQARHLRQQPRLRCPSLTTHGSESTTNVTSNIEGGLLHAATREEIKELQRQGIKVANNNEPALRTPSCLQPKDKTPLLLALGRSQRIAPVEQTPIL